MTPQHSRYDVVIVGGAMLGSSVAWFLTDNPDFNGSILVVERDPTYAWASTSHTNSCIRQQFSAPITAAALQQFVAAAGMGLGQEDDAAIAKVYALHAGLTLPGDEGTEK